MTRSANDKLLDAWRTARDEADRAHRRALEDADKLYEAWLIAQKDAATRGAALPTATWEDRFAAIQVLGEAVLRMRSPGDWYVSQTSIGISNGVIVSSSYGNGATPEQAVEEHWRIYTNVPEGEWIAAGHGDDRVNAVWDTDAWKTWKPERVSS